MQQPIIKWGVLAQGGDGGVGNRTSFVPETGEKTRHRLRTDERQCIENAAESSDMSNERLEVSLNPNHRNRTIREPYEDFNPRRERRRLKNLSTGSRKAA